MREPAQTSLHGKLKAPPEFWVLPEAPVTTQAGLSDSLNGLTKRIEDFLEMSPPDPPLISGDWGSGKTSVLNAVQSALDDHAQ